MRISGKPSGVGSTQNVTGPKASSATATTPVAPSTATDALQVSSAAQLVAVAHEALAVVPDIRTEKVEAIKTQLNANTYRPDGEAVAEGIIKEHLAPSHSS